VGVCVCVSVCVSDDCLIVSVELCVDGTNPLYFEILFAIPAPQ
jgi:hypothetical protein